MFNGTGILVTGGTGSFGRRFIATVLERYKPRRLVVYSRPAPATRAMDHEL
jgi:UDP-N-acetylglucosamine 4,6-dehydratase